jgi:glycosyltransferase involved in cell wall biosynthesis
MIYSPIAEEPLGWILTRMLRIPWVVDWWDNPRPVETKRYSPKFFAFAIYIFLLKRMVRGANAVVLGILPFAVSEFGIDPARIVQVTNGVDPESFQPAGATLDKRSPESTVILFVGYLMKCLGMDTLLSAAALLKQRSINVEMWLVGFEIEREWLASAIHDLQLEEIVKVVGEKPAKEIPAWINSADICVMPFPKQRGLDEIFPIKVYEYLACGKTVISTDLMGVRTIIEDGVNGLLFAPGSCEDLANKIAMVIVDSDLRNRLKSNARASVLKYDWNLVLDRMFSELEATIRRSLEGYEGPLESEGRL